MTASETTPYLYTATCMFGLEGLLGEEIDALGYTRETTMDGRIHFRGDAAACARANIGLRYAERLYVTLGSFEARTFDELFEGTKALPWEDFIGRNDVFPVTGHAIKSALFSVPDCQRIIKKAVSVRLGNRYGLTTLPETGTKYRIEFFLFKDHADLMLELSGDPLHKRGYRPETVTAPIRETLAAAMGRMTRPREDVLLWDPFCGSGTILIETAMQMCHIAPGLHRRFAAERYPQFPDSVWRDAREEATAAIRMENGFHARGTDIDPMCIEIAKNAALRAGVDGHIDFSVCDARAITNPDCRGTIVTNPPYGERLMTLADAEQLYREFGETLRRFPSWQIYILTPDENLPRLLGRHADKIRKLYNGMIPCYYYQFFKPAGSKPRGYGKTGGDHRANGNDTPHGSGRARENGKNGRVFKDRLTEAGREGARKKAPVTDSNTKE